MTGQLRDAGEPGPLYVVKLGGSTLATQAAMLADVVELAGGGARVVVVHGGGAAVSAWMERLGLQPTFKDGLRITDGPTLEVVRMVLAGLINQELVAVAAALGARAVGLTGLDGGLLRARPAANGDLGFVGEICQVEAGVLHALLAGGFLPVVAPLALAEGAAGAGEAPVLYNINADAAAGAVAAALGAQAAVFLTDVAGVRDAAGEVLPHITEHDISSMINDGVISGGMIPKVQACLRALRGAANAVILDGRRPHSLREWAAGQAGGTVISAHDDRA